MSESSALIETAQEKVPSFFYNPADQILPKPGESNINLISKERKSFLSRLSQNMPNEEGTFMNTFGTLEWSLEQLEEAAPDIGKRFKSIGINGIDPVKILNDILTQPTDRKNALKSIPFMKQPMGASPVTGGGIIALSEIDGNLQTREDIKYILLGREYMRSVDLLRATYPKKFIPWNEVPITLKIIDMANPKNTKPTSGTSNQLRQAS